MRTHFLQYFFLIVLLDLSVKFEISTLLYSYISIIKVLGAYVAEMINELTRCNDPRDLYGTLRPPCPAYAGFQTRVGQLAPSGRSWDF